MNKADALNLITIEELWEIETDSKIALFVNNRYNERTQKMRQTLDRLNEWHALTNAGLSLRLGELTAQEVRTVRAVLNAIKGE